MNKLTEPPTTSRDVLVTDGERYAVAAHTDMGYWVPKNIKGSPRGASINFDMEIIGWVELPGADQSDSTNKTE